MSKDMSMTHGLSLVNARTENIGEDSMKLFKPVLETALIGGIAQGLFAEIKKTSSESRFRDFLRGSSNAVYYAVYTCKWINLTINALTH